MLQNQAQIKMNHLDYLLIGVAVFAGSVALSNFNLSFTNLIWIALCGLSLYYAFDGKKATGKDFVVIIVLLVCTLIALKNLEPYVAMVKLLFGAESVPAQIFYSIPIIGNLWAYAIAIIPFAVVQTLEIYVQILEGNRESLKVTIAKLKAESTQGNPDPNLDKRIVELEKKYNDFVLNTLMKFYWYRNVAYIIDAGLVLWFYPPIVGGWGELYWGWPTLDMWDFPNIALSVVILFLFEQLVALYLWLKNVDTYFVKGS